MNKINDGSILSGGPKFHTLGKPMDDNKFEHYMVAAEIVYEIEVEGQRQVGTRHLNCLVVSKKHTFGVAEIGQAQMGIQKNFSDKMVNTPYSIVDVTITALMPLGRMTKEEFNAMPEAK